MSGLEPLVAAEAAAAASTAATTTAAAAAATEAATAAYASAVPGLSAAAMLAAQTGPFGAGGLASTAASAAMPGTLAATMWNPVSSLLNAGTASPMTAMRGLGMGMQALSPTGGTASAYSPPAMKQGRQVNLSEPILSLLASAQPQRRKQPLSLL
jgi:hypothetical protein